MTLGCMKLTAEQVRALGFEWPGASALDASAVSIDGVIDLNAALARLELALEFYERELDAMYAFQRRWNAEWNDITDHREEYHRRCAELREAIAHVKAIIDRAASP